MLHFSSAKNDIVGSRNAMRDALTRALATLGGPADLVVLHTAMGHDFQALLEEAAAIAPNADVVGCTCGGVIGSDGASEKMRTLALMAVRGRGEYAVAHADAVRGVNSFEVAATVAAQLKARNANVNMVNIVASGIDIAGDQAIKGIESVFGPGVPIFGGTSSDNMRAKVSYQFAEGKILERGLLLVGFADESLSLVTGVHHGSAPIGEPFEVTRAEGNRIFELDGKPAWPTLMDALGLDVHIDIAQTFALAALGEALPAELRAAYENDYFIHTIFLVDDERQSFYTPAMIETGTRLSMMRRDEDLMFAGVDRMVAHLEDQLAGRRPVAMFHTDCAARGRLMFNRVLKDELLTRIQYPICGDDEIPWLGLYGFGEFTPVAGVNRFHTQTSSLYAMVRSA